MRAGHWGAEYLLPRRVTREIPELDRARVFLSWGTIETLGIIAGQLGLSGGLWGLVNNANNNFGLLGVCIVGIFIISWIVSTVIYKVKKYDDMEVIPASAAPGDSAD